jgi:SAM-dependent methyltransferase
MMKSFRAYLARRSFNYQWGHLPEGTGLLSDERFANQVESIIAESELRLPREWFAGKRVLDAGCGNGRWINGFLGLGCQVTAFDFSSSALEAVREANGAEVRCVQGDILEVDRLLSGERFDLVWSWGVLHHTRSTAAGVLALSHLVAPDGLLYLYLYGKLSTTSVIDAKLALTRTGMNLLPLAARKRILEWRYGPDEAHQKFDLLSTALNDRFTIDEVKSMLTAAGMDHVVQTMPHSELFVRAQPAGAPMAPLLPEPSRPYWFEQL